MTHAGINAEGDLNLDSIARAALRVIERDGPDGLSMRAVAEQLETTAMALYRHVPNKAALLDLVAELLIEQSAFGRPHSSDVWQQQLTELAREFRVIAQRYPRSFQLIITRRLLTPSGLKPVERVLEPLERAGMRGPQSVRVMRMIVALILGLLTWETTTTSALGGEPSRTMSGVELRQMRQSFPHVWQHAPELAGRDHDVEFEFAIATAIATIERLVERASIPAPAHTP